MCVLGRNMPRIWCAQVVKGSQQRLADFQGTSHDGV